MTTHKEAQEPLGKVAADKVADKKPDVIDAAATELAKDAVKQEAKMATGNESAPEGDRWPGASEIQMFAHLLDDGLAGLEKAIDKKDGIPENKVAGLLILERNGQNRTEYVRLMMKRLGIKDLKAELPQAGGPDYTRDITNLSNL